MRKQLHQTQKQADVQALLPGSTWESSYYGIVVEVRKCNGIAVSFRQRAKNGKTPVGSARQRLSILSVEAFLRRYRELQANPKARVA